MKCAHCSKKIDKINHFCVFCGESTSRQRLKCGIICGLSIFGVIIAVFVLWKNYLLPWQIALFKTRQAIIRYVKKNHPNYHIEKEEVKYSYTTGGGFFPKPEKIKPCAYITFNEEGFNYVVSAFDGVVTGDNYTIKKLSYEIGKFAKEGVSGAARHRERGLFRFV